MSHLTFNSDLRLYPLILVLPWSLSSRKSPLIKHKQPSFFFKIHFLPFLALQIVLSQFAFHLTKISIFLSFLFIIYIIVYSHPLPSQFWIDCKWTTLYTLSLGQLSCLPRTLTLYPTHYHPSLMKCQGKYTIHRKKK